MIQMQQEKLFLWAHQDRTRHPIIVFEQAFAAAARVIAVIQKMIEDLERAVGA